MIISNMFFLVDSFRRKYDAKFDVLMNCVIGLWDDGCITVNNLEIIKYTGNLLKQKKKDFLFDKQKIDILLIIKYLKFYQLVILLSANFGDQNNKLLIEAKNIANDLKKYYNESIRVVFRKIETTAFKEISLIFFDFRTSNEMAKAFPDAYKLAQNRFVSYNSFKTDIYIVQKYIPYIYLCDLIGFTGSPEGNIIDYITQRNTELVDYDIIFAALIRELLQTEENLIKEKLEDNDNFIKVFDRLYNVFSKKSKLSASFDAFIIDLFYTINPEENKVIFRLIQNSSNEALLNGIFNFIKTRIETNGVDKNKKLNNIKHSMKYININGIIIKNILSEENKKFLYRFIQNVDQEESKKLFESTNKNILEVLKQNNYDWNSNSTIDSLSKIIQESLVKFIGMNFNNMKCTQTFFNSVNQLACAYAIGTKNDNIKYFIIWASRNKPGIFQDIKNLNIINNYHQALMQEISLQSDNWKNIIENSPVFYEQNGLLETICKYSNTRTIYSLALKCPYLLNSKVSYQLFNNCSSYSPDFIFHLSIFLNSYLKTNNGFSKIQKILMDTFEKLSPSLIKVLEGYIKQSPSLSNSSIYNTFLSHIHSTNTDKAKKFYNSIKSYFDKYEASNKQQKTIVSQNMV